MQWLTGAHSLGWLAHTENKDDVDQVCRHTKRGTDDGKQPVFHFSDKCHVESGDLAAIVSHLQFIAKLSAHHNHLQSHELEK